MTGGLAVLCRHWGREVRHDPYVGRWHRDHPCGSRCELAEIRDVWGGFGARYSCEVDADAPYAPHIPPPQKGDTVGVEIDGVAYLQPYHPDDFRSMP